MKQRNEVNTWSVTSGVLMAVLFSAAAAYLGLKVGQVFEAAIPIAIIAVGVSAAAKRSNALRENVIIQSIGACSGAVVAGAIFTLPAIYILQAKYPEMSADFLKIFIASLLGGVLGILFLIPFRKYFVEAPQEQFPFPEATATTQVLVSGEKGGSQAKPLLFAGLIQRTRVLREVETELMLSSHHLEEKVLTCRQNLFCTLLLGGSTEFHRKLPFTVSTFVAHITQHLHHKFSIVLFHSCLHFIVLIR